MSLPRSRNQTYGFGVTQGSSTDMNDIQDSIVRHERLLAGPDLVVIDDFVGSAIATSKWIVTGAVAISSGLANSARGIVSLVVNGVNTAMNITSCDMVIGGNDFGFCVGAAASMSGAGGTLHAGLVDRTGLGHNAFFFPDFATGNWWINYPTSSSVNTGVPFSTTTVDKLEVERKAGTLTFYINDVIVRQQADASNLTQCAFELNANRTTSNLTLIADYFKYWAKR